MEEKINNPELTSSSETAVAEGKTTAIIAYITIVGLIIAFIMNTDKKNTFAAYHIRQCLGIALTGLSLGVVNVISILGWLISIFGSLFLLALLLMGQLDAFNGKVKQ